MDDPDTLTDFDRQQIRLVNDTLALLFLPTAVPAFTETDMVAVKRLVRGAMREGHHEPLS